MTDLAPDLNIPNIGNPQIWVNSMQNQKTFKKPDIAMFDNAPSDISLWSFFGKIIIWLAVWLCIVALLFWTLTAIGWLTLTDSWNASPILKVLLAVVWFIVQFIWALALALMYNIFFSKRYYNFGKMVGLIFASSIIFFLFFILIYILFEQIDDLYFVLWFQVVFWLYISLNLMDFLSQPNYSASSLLGNTLWCILTIVVYLFVSQKFNLSYVWISMLAVIFSYSLMIFWAWLWDAIYYKFYEWWNNPFYLPSLNELREERQKEEVKKAEEEEDVNVDMK